MLPLRPFHPGDSVHEIDGTLQGVVLRTSPSGVVVECLDGLEHFFKADELVHDFPWSVGQGVPPQSIAQQKGDAAPRKHAEKAQHLGVERAYNLSYRSKLSVPNAGAYNEIWKQVMGH